MRLPYEDSLQVVELKAAVRRYVKAQRQSQYHSAQTEQYGGAEARQHAQEHVLRSARPADCQGHIMPSCCEPVHPSPAPMQDDIVPAAQSHGRPEPLGSPLEAPAQLAPSDQPHEASWSNSRKSPSPTSSVTSAMAQTAINSSTSHSTSVERPGTGRACPSPGTATQCVPAVVQPGEPEESVAFVLPVSQEDLRAHYTLLPTFTLGAELFPGIQVSS